MVTVIIDPEVEALIVALFLLKFIFFITYLYRIQHTTRIGISSSLISPETGGAAAVSGQQMRIKVLLK